MHIFISMLSLLLDVLNYPSLDHSLYLAIGKLHNGKSSSDFTIIMLTHRKLRFTQKTDTRNKNNNNKNVLNNEDRGLQSPPAIPNTHYSA